MPIDMDEWNKGRIQETNESLVESFLEEGKGKAYNTSEIAFAIFKLDEYTDFGRRFVASWVVQSALDNLVKEGRVQVKSIKTQYVAQKYYTIT